MTYLQTPLIGQTCITNIQNDVLPKYPRLRTVNLLFPLEYDLYYCLKFKIYRLLVIEMQRNVSYFTDLEQISLFLKYNVYVNYFFSIWFFIYSVFKEQQIYSLSNIPAHCSTNSDMHRFHVINERRRCNTLYCTSASCILRICEDAHF